MPRLLSVRNRRFRVTALLKAPISFELPCLGYPKVLFFPLLLVLLGVRSATAQTYAGGSPEVGKVYRVISRHDNGSTVTERPMWNKNGENPTLESGINADDVDGFWILQAVSGGHILLSGSGDGKAFKYVHNPNKMGQMNASGTVLTRVEDGIKSNTTALKHAGGYVTTHNANFANPGMFNQNSTKISGNLAGWTTDFLFEEVQVTRYNVRINGLTDAQRSTAGVKYEGYTSYLNDGVQGIPNGGFFLLPSDFDVSKFSATIVAGETPHILVNGTTIEVYYRQTTLFSLEELSAVPALFPTSELNTLREAVLNRPWGTTYEDIQASLAFFNQQVDAAYQLADGRLFHLKNASYSSYYLRASGNNLSTSNAATRTANDIFYLTHLGNGDYRVMAYRENGADQPFPNTGTNSQGITLLPSKSNLAGIYRLNTSPALTTPGRIVLVCKFPNDSPHNGIHVNAGKSIVVWNAIADASQWIVEPVSDAALVQPYRAAVNSFYRLPALYAAKANVADVSAIDALKQGLEGKPFATITQVRQAQSEARIQIEAFCRTAEGRLVFFQNGGSGSWANYRMRYNPTALNSDGDRALTGDNLDAFHHKSEVFRVELTGLDIAYRPSYHVYNLTAAAYLTPTGAEWADIVFSNTEKGVYRLEAQNNNNRIIFFCTNGKAAYNNPLLHLENSGDISTWNNASDTKSHWIVVPIERLLLDGYETRLNQMKRVPLLYEPVQIADLQAGLLPLTFNTETEIDASLEVANAKLLAAYQLATGKLFYLRHESGARYASAPTSSAAANILPKATGTGMPGLEEVFYLTHLSDGIYVIQHFASGKALVRTEADNSLIRLMEAADAVFGRYRLVFTTTDNRVGIEAQNPTNTDHPWWHSPDNSKIVPWEKNSGNSYWDIELPNDTQLDAIRSAMPNIPSLGTTVGTYYELSGPTRTAAEVQQYYDAEWGTAAAETDEAARTKAKADVLRNLNTWLHTQIALNMPVPGMFYRFTNKVASKTLQSPETTGMFKLLGDPTAAATRSNIFYLAPDHSLLTSVSGRYAKGAALVDPVYSHDHFSFGEAPFAGRSLYTLSPQPGVFLSVVPNQLSDVSIRQEGVSVGEGWRIEQIDEFPITFRSIPDAITLLGNATRSVATLFCPVALGIPSGIRAYQASLNAERTALQLTEIIDFIPANTPVVVVGDAGTTARFPLRYGDTTAPPVGNVLVGSAEALSSPGCFTLQSPSSMSKTGFYPYSEALLSGFRAYLPNAAALAPTQRLTLRFPETTGMELPVDEEAAPAVYDLSGRRVERPDVHGIFIVGRRKVVR